MGIASALALAAYLGYFLASIVFSMFAMEKMALIRDRAYEIQSRLSADAETKQSAANLAAEAQVKFNKWAMFFGATIIGNAIAAYAVIYW